MPNKKHSNGQYKQQSAQRAKQKKQKNKDSVARQSDREKQQGSIAALHRKITQHARCSRLRLRRLRRQNSGPLSRLAAVAMLLLALVAALLSGGGGVAFAYYQMQAPLLQGSANHALFQTTHIYDRNGKLLYDLYDRQEGSGRRTYINYKDIARPLIDATVASEDRSFWTNLGLDFFGIGRALVTNIQRQAIVEGASTITEQLIKNQFFMGQPRTLQVKGEEAILSVGLTRQYPKWKIMEMYLNTVYYGNLNYGVEAAAQDYFGLEPQCNADRSVCKPAVAQLTLGQASMLAGLPQSPSYFNPIYNKEAALERQRQVLRSMLEEKMIKQEQMVEAQREMQGFNFTSHARKMHAPHFVQYVIERALIPLLGVERLARGGFSVYTTLDLDLEQRVEQSIYNHLYQSQQSAYMGYYGPLNTSNNVNNGAAVVMNPVNGEILAMSGSAKYDMNTPQMHGQHNAAVSLRQPGSAFKPIIYATAFEMGWYPAMIIPDHKTTYPADPPKWYTPQNYDEKFHTGYPMTARTALANSFNIPAIDTLMFTGFPQVLNMAGRLGLSEVEHTPLANLGPSMALGAKEVSLLNLTGAYATFANRGIRVPPVAVLKILDNKGQLLYQYDERRPQQIRAVGEDVAFLVSSVLADKPARYREFSPGNPLELSRPAAAKTGTTDSFRDNWTLGYTPYLTVGVWAGNSDNSVMHNIIGITGAGPIWHDIMEYASQRYQFPPDDFVKPANVQMGTVSAYSGLLPRPGEQTVSDWFIAGTMPTVQGNYYDVPAEPAKCDDKDKENCQVKSSGRNGANSSNPDAYKQWDKKEYDDHDDHDDHGKQNEQKKQDDHDEHEDKDDIPYDD